MNDYFPCVMVGPDVATSLKMNLENGLKAHFGSSFGVTDYNYIQFKDGDKLFQIGKNIRDNTVYIVIAADSDVNVMQTARMIDAALLASASKITVVFSYFPGRQDRKDRPRVGITAALIARMIVAAFGECASKKVMIFEPHCDQLEMAFNGLAVDKLWATTLLIEAFHARFPDVPKDMLSVGGPDAGSLKLVRKWAQIENLEGYFHGDKRRVADDKMKIINLIGDVKEHVIIRDDLTDTGGTIIECVDFCAKRGAKHAYPMIGHGILADNAVERLQEAQRSSILRHVFLTDSVNTDHKKLPPDLFTVVSCGGMLAEAIFLNHTKGSLSQMPGMH